MSFERSGAEYLRRLKMDLEHPHGCQQPTSSTAQTDIPASPQECRHSPRYKCQGSAQFRAQGSDMRTWGTLTDLSLRGCYVEMMATFSVGAVVDLLLELNGVQAQVKGEVRVSYPCLGVGTAFRALSDENRVHLLDMVRSLDPAEPKAPDTKSAGVPPNRALPIIVNAGAPLQALADFFEAHVQLTKEEFVRILRKSQGIDDFRDNHR